MKSAARSGARASARAPRAKKSRARRSPPATAGAGEGEPVEAATHAMSRHLIGLATVMRLRMRAGLLERGHELRPSTAQVIPNLPADGLRMTELAARLRLTLQRAGQLVAELEEVGYLERVPDPMDGRARRVTYTRRGRALIRDIDEITRDTMAHFSDKLGRDRFARLCELLAELDVAVNGVDAPVRVVGVAYEEPA